MCSYKQEHCKGHRSHELHVTQYYNIQPQRRLHSTSLITHMHHRNCTTATPPQPAESVLLSLDIAARWKWRRCWVCTWPVAKSLCMEMIVCNLSWGHFIDGCSSTNEPKKYVGVCSNLVIYFWRQGEHKMDFISKRKIDCTQIATIIIITSV